VSVLTDVMRLMTGIVISAGGYVTSVAGAKLTGEMVRSASGGMVLVAFLTDIIRPCVAPALIARPAVPAAVMDSSVLVAAAGIGRARPASPGTVLVAFLTDVIQRIPSAVVVAAMGSIHDLNLTCVFVC